MHVTDRQINGAGDEDETSQGQHHEGGQPDGGQNIMPGGAEKEIFEAAGINTAAVTFGREIRAGKR